VQRKQGGLPQVAPPALAEKECRVHSSRYAGRHRQL
jgi:hypothetical protein